MSIADDDVFYHCVRWANRITAQGSGKSRPSSDSFRNSTDPARYAYFGPVVATCWTWT